MRERITAWARRTIGQIAWKCRATAFAHPAMFGPALARDPAGEALVDEGVEIVAVAHRDVEAAPQGQLEARVIAFLRRRHAATPRYAVLILSKARRGQRDRGDGQGRRNASQAHRVAPFQAFPSDCRDVEPRAGLQHAIPVQTRPAATLVRDPAGEALVHEPVEIAEVADRDGEAALQGQVEARIILFGRCRHAAAPWDAVLVLGNARR